VASVRDLDPEDNQYVFRKVQVGNKVERPIPREQAQRPDAPESLWNEYGVTPEPVSDLTAKVLEWMGLHLRPFKRDEFREENVLSKYAGGLDVTFSRTSGPAEKAGITESVIVVGFETTMITTLEELDQLIQSAAEKNADSVKFSVLKNGKTQTISVPFPVKEFEQDTPATDP
jgi:hypothetical protein